MKKFTSILLLMAAMFTTVNAQETVNLSTGTFGGELYGDKECYSQWTSENGVTFVSTDGNSNKEIGTMKLLNGDLVLYVTTEVTNPSMLGTKYTITAPEGYVVTEMTVKNGSRTYETSIDYGYTSIEMPKSNTAEETITFTADNNFFYVHGKVANRDCIKITSLTITPIGDNEDGEGEGEVEGGEGNENEGEGNETSINEVKVENTQVIYDLTGRRVNEITKAGIYIINGKKVIK
ncbi:MAG: hypothetical protein J6Q73_03450 [Bacteroidaceae bacterium]|nr:hypothetical protein [Bacteroidaceae bacterium]